MRRFREAKSRLATGVIALCSLESGKLVSRVVYGRGFTGVGRRGFTGVGRRVFSCVGRWVFSCVGRRVDPAWEAG
jgi:hypothetical protein